ncbi:hypothetical protein OJ997_27670 [Solirubrobacter phytolaccae]|uniref:Uncharacterized protein n=1 Tax=Solirubrobacter phytolaccae TaxID=1404360 RepID=A0A9X3NEZ7_9ACTN|nr:hypothetical protein [Solirubrobacter phytolaccae]MDA0184119.1 hypothetical protein [Solirubrobacter phytolaccae]
MASDDARVAAFYLMTCTHRTSEGLFFLPGAYASADLGWTPERFGEALSELLRHGFVEYDRTADVCLLVDALVWQAPAHGNAVKAAVKALRELPQTPLLGRLYRRCVEIGGDGCERFRQGLIEGFAESLGEGIAEPPSPSLALPRAPSPSPGAADSEREDASRICTLLADQLLRADMKARPAKASAEWIAAATALLDEDDRTVEEVETALSFVEGDDFWRPRIQSPALLRKHFAQLLARAMATPEVADIAEKRAAVERAQVAAGALSDPGDVERSDWARLHPALEGACQEAQAAAHVSEMALVGVDADGVLVVDAPDAAWRWASRRFTGPMLEWAKSVGVRARLASKDEHDGRRGAAA